MSKIAIIILIFLYGEACAMGGFLDRWSSRYPESEAQEAGCQLCHQREDGGDGWNAYGWRLRTEMSLSGRPFETAVEILEGLNPDLDPTDTLSITEIELGTQPGWTVGARNTVFFRSGSILLMQLPPQEFDSSIDVDPPVPIGNPFSPQILLGDIKVDHSTIASGFQKPFIGARAIGLRNVVFVVEQRGVVWAVNVESGQRRLFLDVRDNLVSQQDLGERGLIGMVFAPDFLQTGIFYTHQSEPAGDFVADFSTMSVGVDPDHQSVVSSWRLISDPRQLFSQPSSIESRRVLMRVDQPQSNNNGGAIGINPADGYLYVSIGDGGNQDDEEVGHGRDGNGQNNETPFGAILRIDPNARNSENGQYGVPLDNPFIDGSGLDEIYAHGFRNVRHFSFDSVTGDFYAADHGQYLIEEINLVSKGGNYGWNRKEGSFYFYPNGPIQGYVSDEPHSDLPADLIDPIMEYDRDDGSRVVGGHVYRGSNISALYGFYTFADDNGRIYYQDEDGSVTELVTTLPTGTRIKYLIQGGDDELYALVVGLHSASAVDGSLIRIGDTRDRDLCFPIKSERALALICL